MNIITRAMNANALRQVEPLDTLLFEGEVNAHQFVITPAAGVSFEGASVTAYFVRSDTQRVDLTGQVSGGNAVVTISGNCCAVAGRYKLTIFAVTADETAAIYACAGTVKGTRGSEVAGDTEPIVEPETVDLTPITNRLTALETAVEKMWTIMKELEGLYYGNDGTVTINGVTITRVGGIYTFNGTATDDFYVHLNGVELEASAVDKTDGDWSIAANNIDIPYGNYYINVRYLTEHTDSVGDIMGKTWSNIINTEPSDLGSGSKRLVAPNIGVSLTVFGGMSYDHVQWILTMPHYMR